MTQASTAIVFCHSDDVQDEPFSCVDFKFFKGTAFEHMFDDFGQLDVVDRLTPLQMTFKADGKLRTDFYNVFTKCQGGKSCD